MQTSSVCVENGSMAAAIKTSAAHLHPPGMHALIKRRTSDLHRQLDSAPALLALMRPGLELPSYAAILQRFVAAYACVEPLLGRLAPAKPLRLPDYKPRLPALRADLAVLPPAAAGAKKAPLELPSGVDATAHYLGLRYVLEGSTQGARLISARLEANLPQLRAGCFAYWQLQREAAADWPSLCACLEDVKPDQAEDSLRAAEAAFSIFIDAFLAAEPTP